MPNSDIWSHPEIHGGQPMPQGSRIPIAQILRLLQVGFTWTELQVEYGLTPEQITIALAYAAELVESATQKAAA